VAVLEYSSAANPLHYIECDHLGTPRVVIEQDRNLAVWAWPVTGEAFGNTPPDEDPDGDGTNFTLDMRFPGQRYDSASGLYYNYFRDYEPGTGRYTQSDPIGLAGGLTTYGYGEGNPLLFTDPRGLQSTALCANPANAVACAEAGMLGIRPIAIPIPVAEPKPATCPDEECDPPVGTICWELHDGTDRTPHGMSDSKGNKIPPAIPHYHTWQMNKSPIKGCTWNKRKSWKYTFPEPPPGTAACQSYPSWVNNK